MRSMRREGELRREYLLNKAKILQARATKHKARVSEDVSCSFVITGFTARSLIMVVGYFGKH